MAYVNLLTGVLGRKVSFATAMAAGVLLPSVFSVLEFTVERPEVSD